MSSSCPATAPRELQGGLGGAGARGAGAAGGCSLLSATALPCSSLPAPAPTGSVHPPCSNGVAWSFETCNFDDFNGWSDAADEALRARGVNLDAYKYK